MATTSGQFALDISAWVKKQEGKLDDIVRIAVLDLANRIITASPVGDPTTWKHQPPPKGYRGGRFRASWDMSVSAPPTAIHFGIDPTGEASRDRIKAAIPADAARQVYYINNNTPYALRLENGWSYMQAPLGIVGLVVFDWQQIVNAAAETVKGSQ